MMTPSRRRRSRALALGWWLLALSACGSDNGDRNNAAPDAGPSDSADGGSNPRAGSEAPPPNREDGGSEPRAGRDAPPPNRQDAGPSEDAAVAPDAAVLPDAAVPDDGGGPDAAPEVRSGSVFGLAPGGGRVTGGGFVLDFRIGHPIAQETIRGGNLVFEGAVELRP